MDQDNKPKNKFVKTYPEDMARALEGSQGGLIRKIIHGEEREEREEKNLSPLSRKNKLFMLGSFFLLFLALSIISFLLLDKGSPVVPVQKQFTPIVFTDKIELVEVTDWNKDKIAEVVADKVKDTKVKNGGVEGIYLTYDKAIVGLRKFIKLIEGNFNPGDEKVVDDNFLLGAVKGGPAYGPTEGKGEFFMLLKVRSVADVFPKLRAWEPKMFYDLHGFLGIEIKSETSYLLTQDFEDGIIENKNARVLYNNGEGGIKKIILMYILADDNSIIVTGGKDAVHEVMLRLSGSQIKK